MGRADRRHYGVVLFDEPKHPEAGWAMQAGDRPFRIESVGNLDSDVFWLTNLEYKAFRESNLDRSPRFLEDGYLRLRLNAMLADWGLREETPEIQLRSLTALFHATMTLAEKLYGIDYVPPYALAVGLAELLGPKVHQEQPADATYALESASQSYVFCQTPKWRKHDKVVTFSLHRGVHAQALASASVPVGRFQTLSNHELPDGADARLEWAFQEERPLLLRVKLTNIDPDVSPLINYGAGARARRGRVEGKRVQQTNLHEWITAPELKLLAKHAQVEILAVMAAERYIESPIRLPAISSELSDLAYLSYAYGLLAENAWVAGTVDSEGKKKVSPLSVWLQSLDRARCFAAALAISRQAEDVVIMSYGYGRITLRLPDMGSHFGSDLANIALPCDVLSPVLAPGLYRSEVLVTKPIHSLQELYLHGQRDALHSIDQALLEAV